MICLLSASRVLIALGTLFCAAASAGQGAGLRLVGQARLEHPTEIAAWDAASGRVLVTLGGTASVAVVSLDAPGSPEVVGVIDFGDVGEAVNSVAAHGGLCAAALTAEKKTDPGWVVFFRASGERVATVRVGAMPDMVCFTPDGRFVLSANEGEPNKKGTVDPAGSVSVIDARSFAVSEVLLSEMNPSEEVGWFTPAAEMHAAMIEPEYITVTGDSRLAYVVCQENNAVAVVDVGERKLVRWHDLGVVERGAYEALRQPDGVVLFETDRGLRLVTANEGDPRDVWGVDGVVEVDGVDVAASSAGDGRRATRFGTGGVTLYDGEMRALCDTGADIVARLEEMVASELVRAETALAVMDRAGKRGVEPEGLAQAEVGGERRVFVGLERAGMVAHYIARDDDTLELMELVEIPSPGSATAAPEGLLVVPAGAAGNARALLVVTDEVHGTLSVFEIGSD